MLNHIYSLSPLIIPISCFILIAIFYSVILRKKLSQTYFLSTATIILVLFFSGLLNFKGSLLLGYSVLFSFSLFCLVFSIISYVKNKNLIKEISLIKGLIIIAFFLTFSIFINYGRMFSIWDELTHWGSALKNMYFLNALGTLKEASGSVGSYPPGISIYQYFWIKPFRSFTEFPAFIASNMIFFSLITVFIKRFDLKSFLFSVSIFLIPILFLPTFFSSIYVDSLLGILLGCIFLAYFIFNRKEDKTYRIILISSIVAVLTLSKDVGLILSGIALMVILIDIFFFQRNSIIKDFSTKNNLFYKLRTLSPLLIPAIVSITLRFIWSLHLKLTNAFTSSGAKIEEGIKGTVERLISNNLLPYQYETIENFKKALIEDALYPLEFSYVVLLLLIIFFLIIVIFVVKSIKPSKNRLLLAFLGTIVGGILYTCLILFLYISVFSPYESIMLASYSRYLLSYFISIFFFFLLFIIQKSKISLKGIGLKNTFLDNLRLIVFVVVLFFSFHYLINRNENTIKTNIVGARASVHDIRGMRDGYDQILIWKKYFSEINNKDLYIISSGDQGYDYLAMIHTLYPIYIEWKQDYSVALEPYYPQLNDPWTKIFTAEEWGNYVKEKYKFIFVFSYDEKFKETYGHLFDELANNSFYQVNTDEEGNLKITSLPKP
jgi:hypothetical protein